MSELFEFAPNELDYAIAHITSLEGTMVYLLRVQNIEGKGEQAAQNFQSAISIAKRALQCISSIVSGSDKEIEIKVIEEHGI